MLSESVPVSCAAVADLLPSIDDPELLPLPARRHMEQCLRCQAEAVGYRRMRRLLASLADHPPCVEPGFGVGVSISVDHGARLALRSLPARAAAAAIGGLAAAASLITIAVGRNRFFRPVDLVAFAVVVRRRLLVPVALSGVAVRRVLRPVARLGTAVRPLLGHRAQARLSPATGGA